MNRKPEGPKLGSTTIEGKTWLVMRDDTSPAKYSYKGQSDCPTAGIILWSEDPTQGWVPRTNNLPQTITLDGMPDYQLCSKTNKRVWAWVIPAMIAYAGLNWFANPQLFVGGLLTIVVVVGGFLAILAVFMFLYMLVNGFLKF